jgi:hypothetical protein
MNENEIHVEHEKSCIFNIHRGSRRINKNLFSPHLVNLHLIVFPSKNGRPSNSLALKNDSSWHFSQKIFDPVGIKRELSFL